MKKREHINIRIDEDIKADMKEIKERIKESSGFEITQTQVIKRALKELNNSLK